MVQALGYVSEAFDPASPGRLCRGRERWIEYETMEPKAAGETLHRLILSGATFSDDRARDAQRGLGFGPITMSVLLRTLLGEGELVAYCEEGHPHEIPDSAAGVEHHTVARPGGSLREWRVRWHKAVSTADDLEAAVEAGADVFIRLRAPTDSPAKTIHESPLIPPLADEADSLPSLLSEELARALFFLTGFRAAGRPNRYFQPWGIPAVLEHVEAVANEQAMGRDQVPTHRHVQVEPGRRPIGLARRRVVHGDGRGHPDLFHLGALEERVPSALERRLLRSLLLREAGARLEGHPKAR